MMIKNFFLNLQGPFLVGLAAFLWATDAIIRYPTIDSIDPGLFIFVEHFLATLILIPWIWSRHPKEAFKLNLKEWIAAFIVGAAGSAIATLFFVASFRYVNPSISILLQKLQPLMVVMIAFLFLGEKPNQRFYFCGSIALIAGIVLSFPDLNFRFLHQGMHFHSLGIQYSLGAALIWASSTVAGKFLLKKIHPSVATFWRFFFGWVAISIVLIEAHSKLPLRQLFQHPESIFVLLYLSLIPGLLAISVYYRGLAKTPAIIATLVELIYPIGAVVLNTLFLKIPLNPVQMVAGIILIIAITILSFK